MSEYLTNTDPERAAKLKLIVDRLAGGAKPSEVKREFHELIKDADAVEAAASGQSHRSFDPSTDIPLSTGGMPLEWLDRVLKMLPLDISFVDADDKVRYYSDSPHRVFPRSPGIIGRSVQNCHPQKSVATVERILDAFKKKEQDRADFWLEMNGRFILISYKAIYDDTGAYLGTLETSMDATEIRALTGQRRLLDW